MLLTLIDLTGSLGWMAISAPFAVLALVLVWALIDVKRAPKKRQDSAGAAARAAGPAGGARSLPPPALPVEKSPPQPRQELQPGSPAGVAPPSTPEKTPAIAAPPKSQALPPRTDPPAAVAPASVAPAPVAPASAPRIGSPAPPPPPPAAAPSLARPVVDTALVASLERSIRAGIGSGDEAGVARLSLQLARALPAGQEHGHDVESYLRRAITIAMRLGDTATHAAARLELGDRVGGRGDMITACEHWQIARQIFWDENRRDGIADADQRMIANGCPTDWVLNDF